MEDITRHITICVDGSSNAHKSFDYVQQLYGPEMDIAVKLVYVLPSLPALVDEGEKIDKAAYAAIMNAEQKILKQAKEILENAKKLLIDKGLDEKRIKTLYRKQEGGISQNICKLAFSSRTDAVLLTRRGRGETDIETYVMGRVSNSMVESCKDSPVWVLGGLGRTKKVLICIDSSENALRAVDHAGFMLAHRDSRITLFHAMRNLRRFVPGEVIADSPELEKLWEKREGKDIAPYMKEAKEILVRAGIPEESISSKVAGGSRSPAEDILREARDHEHGTVVIGKRGQSRVKEFLFGSVTSKLLQKATGRCLWIVQ